MWNDIIRNRNVVVMGKLSGDIEFKNAGDYDSTHQIKIAVEI